MKNLAKLYLARALAGLLPVLFVAGGNISEAQPAPRIQGPILYEPLAPQVFEGDLRQLPKTSPWREGERFREVEDMKEQKYPDTRESRSGGTVLFRRRRSGRGRGTRRRRCLFPGRLRRHLRHRLGAAGHGGGHRPRPLRPGGQHLARDLRPDGQPAGRPVADQRSLGRLRRSLPEQQQRRSHRALRPSGRSLAGQPIRVFRRFSVRRHLADTRSGGRRMVPVRLPDDRLSRLSEDRRLAGWVLHGGRNAVFPAAVWTCTPSTASAC